MKKKLLSILLTVLFLVGLVGLANASFIGNSIIDRPNLDGWTEYTTVDTSLQFSDTGVIDTWFFYSKRSEDIYLQVFRNLGSDTYQVVGETFVSALPGIVTINLGVGDKIPYQNGDFIGWTYAGLPIIPYTDGGNTTHWPSMTGMGVTVVGNTINLPGNGNRTYSIGANTLPTPEPASMILLGTGLVGVAGAVRKRKKKQG